MKEWLKWVSLFSVVFVNTLAFGKIETELNVANGYRSDDLKFSLHGVQPDDVGGLLGVASDLNWKNLDIDQLSTHGKVVVNDTFVFKGNFSYGWILDGQVQNSDFVGDVKHPRQEEFSRTNHSAEGGSVLDTSSGMGLQFDFCSNRMSFTPLVGYAYQEQNLEVHDGVVTLNQIDDTPVGSPTGDIHSSYETQWHGPWLGMDLSYDATKKLTLLFGFEYHFVNYSAVGNWAQRDDFQHPKSYSHDADGDGLKLSGGADYAFSSHWSVNLNLTYQDWSTDTGEDRTFFVDGTSGHAILDEVNWKSWNAALGLTYHF